MEPTPVPTTPPAIRSSSGGQRAHRWRIFCDRHALVALAVAGGACALSLGGVYALYFAHVLRTARNASSVPLGQGCLLLFGKHVPGGRIDADFDARLQRAAEVWRARPERVLLLLGGAHEGGPSEAEVAHRGLLAAGVSADASILLESESLDTLQNLRNARELLRGQPGADPVALLSSRYHLARCALLARSLGYDFELCAAEPRLRWHPATLWHIARESAWVCWIDIGTRWARLVGHRGIMARVS